MLIEFPESTKKKFAGLDGHEEACQRSQPKPVRFDEAYLTRLRNNDEETARHFQRHFRKVVGNMLFGKFYRQREEDLADDVMAAAIEKIMAGEPRDPAFLPAYVRKICTNFIRREIDRGPKHDRVDLDLEKMPGIGKTPEETVRAKERAKAVWEVLAALRFRYRNLLIDVFYYELDRDEVRRKYGKTPEQMRLILFHARRRFQKEWWKRNESAS